MNSSLPQNPKLPIGTVVYYKPEQRNFHDKRYVGKRAIVTQHAASEIVGYHIKFVSGVTLLALESDLEPISQNS
jgi:hypothetical protein